MEPNSSVVFSRSRFFFLIFTLACLGASAFAFVVESRAYIFGKTTAIDRFNAIEEGSSSGGFSIFAQTLALNDCLEAMAGPTGLVQPTNRRKLVAENCLKVSAAMVETMPSFALAWFVSAYSASELGQQDTFNDAFAAAQITAPNGQWLAEFRVALAEENYQWLTPENRKRETADLALLVNSRRGIRSIARRYIDQFDFRERITAIVETQSAKNQARFVNNVREIMQEMRLQ